MSVTSSVEELIEGTKDQDNRAVFKDLWDILSAVKDKIGQRFLLQKDPCCEDLENFTGVLEGSIGRVQAYTCDEMDWLIHSFIGTPGQGFTNMHLTAWLAPLVRVPHFGMALGTIPDLFVYLDYIPRVDVMADLDYLDRYVEPLNETFLAYEKDEAFSPFVSQNVTMRSALTAASLCYVAKPSGLNIKKIEKTAMEMVERWLLFYDLAERVPVSMQMALAERDLMVRRAIVERDPANVMGEKIFGEKMTKRLVGTLWGEGRKSKRAGGIIQ